MYADRKPVPAKAARSSSAGGGHEKAGSETPEAASQKAKRKSEVVVEAEKEPLKPKKQKVEEPEEAIGKRRRAPSAKGKAAVTEAAAIKEAASVTKDTGKQDSGSGQGKQPAQRAPRKSSIYRFVFSCCGSSRQTV